MAFNRFTKNVLNVSALPDRVQNQASTLKATFDQAGVDIKEALNALIAELEASTSASNIGANVSSVTTKTVQAILTNFEGAIANRYTKNEIDTLVSGNTNNLVADIDVNLTTGVITVTKKDGTVETFDTALEKVPAKFEIVESGTSLFLKITNVDGTSTQTNITDLMNIYDFSNTNDIAFNVSGTGNEKVVTASIRPNSIGLDKLSLSVMTTLEGYMTSARDSANAAKTSEISARDSANTATKAAEIASEGAEIGKTAIKKATEAESYAHGGTGTREGEDTDNAKYYSQVAKEVAGGDFVTSAEMEAYAQKKGTAPTYEETALSGEVIETELPLAMESILKISGNSEQDSRSGKNLLNVTANSTTDKGVTATVNKDGSVTINGTNTATTVMYLRLGENITLPAGTYTLSNSNSNVHSDGFIFYDDGRAFPATGTSTITLNSEATIKPYIKVNVGVTVNNQTVYPMIEEGSTATAYEPYGVMPSPDYPSEIRSVKSKSDNLFDINNMNVVNGAIAISTSNIVALNSKIFYVECKGNTQYYLSRKNTASRLRVGTSDTLPTVGINLLQAIDTNDTRKSQITTHANAKYLVVNYYEAGADANEELTLEEMMLNKGDKALPYQPYGYVPVEAKVEGKNLFDKTDILRDYYISANGEVVSEGGSFTSNYIEVSSGDYITSATDLLMRVAVYDKDKKFIRRIITQNSKNFLFTINSNEKYVRIGTYLTSLHTTQLEEGSTATAYEPYKAKIISLPLGDIELRSTPDGTRDTFERVDGVWNYRGDITPFTITEDMVEGVNLTYHPNSPLAHVSLSSVGASKINYKSKICLMTNYKEQKPTGTEGEHGRFVTSASQNRLQILNKNITSLETAKTILAGETGIIKLDTPTYTPITDTALIQALDELEQLILHKGYNRITVTSVNGVKAYLDLSIPSTASVTEVVETESSLDMPVVVVAGEGDVKPKVANQMTVNPSTGEAKINGEKVATEKYVNNLFQASETDLEAGVSTLETGKIYFVYE